MERTELLEEIASPGDLPMLLERLIIFTDELHLLKHTMTERTLRPRSLNSTYISPPSDHLSPSPKPSTSKPKPSKSKRSSVIKNHSVAPVIAVATKVSQNLQSMLPTAPLFAPLRHSKPLRNPQNVLPRHISQADVIEPGTIVNLFFTEELMMEMTKNTNLYAERKRAAIVAREEDTGDMEGRDWYPVVLAELRCWIGIIIYMGVCKMPAVEDYWKHDGLYPLHHIRDHMSLTRFQQIRRYFHVAHPDSPKETAEGQRLWHAKVDPILDQLRTSSRTYRTPASQLALDEAMIRCTGHSKDTYKMPNKPIDQGFKFHCLAFGGYIYDFHPTSNQCGPDPIPSSKFPEVNDMSTTSQLVFDMIQRNCSTFESDQSFNVFLDNFYVNLPLFAALRKRLGVGACGTARTNSKDFPPELAVPKNAKLDYHFKTGIVKNNVAVILWMDSAPVCVMTTIHHVKGRHAGIMKARKKPGPKSTNASGVRKSKLWKEGEWVVVLEIPRAINDYNYHMNGVDVADQLRSYYETHMISRRTWYPIFFWALDTALVNAYLIYKDCPQAQQNIEHKDFRMEAAWGMILGWKGGSRRGLSGKRKQSGSSSEEPTTKRPCYVTSGTHKPRSDGSGTHIPVHIDGRQDCVHCRWGRKDEKKVLGVRDMARTRWKCATCDLPLCLTAERNCFIDFHSS